MSKEINIELALQLKNGDENAFEIIFKSFFEPIVNFADEYVGEFEVSRNIAQTVFMRLWENRLSINPDLNLKSYLYTSARNLCISHLRRLKAQDNYFEKKKKSYEDFSLNQEALSYLDFNTIDLDSIESIINSTIDSLPKRCKEVFLLSRIEGVKNQEVANQLDISVKSVEANITRALKILKENLKDYLPNAILTIFIDTLF